MAILQTFGEGRANRGKQKGKKQKTPALLPCSPLLLPFCPDSPERVLNEDEDDHLQVSPNILKLANFSSISEGVASQLKLNFTSVALVTNPVKIYLICQVSFIFSCFLLLNGVK